MAAVCYIGLGSNLDQPLQQVESAVKAIKQLGTVLAQSPWYQSQAIGPGDQDDYINGVIALETQLEPLALLHALQKIENQQGRVRTIRWGERTLDLDILLYEQTECNSEELTLPHPRLCERAFVLYPLLDIAKDIKLPNGQLVSSFKAAVSQQKLEKLAQTR